MTVQGIQHKGQHVHDEEQCGCTVVDAQGEQCEENTGETDEIGHVEEDFVGATEEGSTLLVVGHDC